MAFNCGRQRTMQYSLTWCINSILSWTKKNLISLRSSRIKWSRDLFLKLNGKWWSSILDRFLRGETRKLRWCFNIYPLHVISAVDCKTVGFFLKISKEIGKAWPKSLTRAKRAGVWGQRKKTDCPFSIQWVRSDQGVQKCRRAVKNLFATPPSLWIW